MHRQSPWPVGLGWAATTAVCLPMGETMTVRLRTAIETSGTLVARRCFVSHRGEKR
jgi:hypothetical protein